MEFLIVLTIISGLFLGIVLYILVEENGIFRGGGSLLRKRDQISSLAEEWVYRANKELLSVNENLILDIHRNMNSAQRSVMRSIVNGCISFSDTPFEVARIKLKLRSGLERIDRKNIKYIKNNPKIMQMLLDNPSHPQHELAKKASSIGLIEVGVLDQVVMIDGKEYILKAKKRI